MVSIFKKKAVEVQSDSLEEPLVVLRGLEKEEVSLMEEKRELLALKENCKLRLKKRLRL